MGETFHFLAHAAASLVVGVEEFLPERVAFGLLLFFCYRGRGTCVELGIRMRDRPGTVQCVNVACLLVFATAAEFSSLLSSSTIQSPCVRLWFPQGGGCLVPEFISQQGRNRATEDEW